MQNLPSLLQKDQEKESIIVAGLQEGNASEQKPPTENETLLYQFYAALEKIYIKNITQDIQNTKSQLDSYLQKNKLNLYK